MKDNTNNDTFKFQDLCNSDIEEYVYQRHTLAKPLVALIALFGEDNAHNWISSLKCNKQTSSGESSATMQAIHSDKNNASGFKPLLIEPTVI